jgi:hypothetical protein
VSTGGAGTDGDADDGVGGDDVTTAVSGVAGVAAVKRGRAVRAARRALRGTDFAGAPAKRVRVDNAAGAVKAGACSIAESVGLVVSVADRAWGFGR